jgi:O-antigen ligase
MPPRTKTIAVPDKPSWPDRWIWYMVVAGVIGIGCFVYPGTDRFRRPKELLFRTEAILIVALFSAAWTLNQIRFHFDRRDPVVLLTSATLAWTLITTLTSTNRLVSVESVLFVGAAAIIFLTTYWLAAPRGLSALATCFVPAVVNSVLVLLQEFQIWNPLFTSEQIRNGSLGASHLFSTALIGNPDDVGAYFLGPTVAAAALFVCDRERRTVFGPLLAIFVAVLLTSRSITAIIATVAAIVALAFLISWRHVVLTTIVVAVVLGSALIGYGPLRYRATTGVQLAREANLDSLLSGRGTAFLAAMAMFREHPLFGVGPGCFGYQYFPYKVRVESEHAGLERSTSRGASFGEAHNDHLQTLAVSGLPGYLLFLGFVFLVGRVSFMKRTRNTDLRLTFVRLFAFPFTTGMLVLMLAQFPLEMASTLCVGVFLTALTLAWSRL